MMTLTRDDKTPELESTDPIPVEINMMRPMTAGNQNADKDCSINMNQMEKNNFRINRRPQSIHNP